MKKLYWVMAIVILGFMGYQTYNSHQLEKRLKKAELMQLTQQAGADFRPFTAFEGSPGGVDQPTNVDDGDVGFLVLEENATYGDMFFPYALDTDGGSGDSFPEYIESGDGGSERWRLAHGGFGGIMLHAQSANDPSPTSDVIGWMTLDHDGANETGDMAMRLNDGTNETLGFRKIHCIHATIVAPNDMDDAERDLLPIWSNETGMVFNITKIEAWSETDSMEVTLKEYGHEDFSSSDTIDVVNTGTTGTDVSHVVITAGFDDSQIDANDLIVCDFDDTDEPGFFKITICGWFNADVD